MTTYESEIKTILSDSKMVFAKLSDLNNLATLKDKVPADSGVSEMTYDTDTVSFNVNAIGKITLRIVERVEYKTIKFEAENSPIAFNLWIQLVEKAENDTKLKVTLKADLPMMIKMMLGSKLQDFIDQFANGLTKIEY
ncbi:MAG: SRPBCC family protein [Paludibacteraceae bacterium]|nr:SRPBCC family protein [Paludibacteraceae bacterium]